MRNQTVSTHVRTVITPHCRPDDLAPRGQCPSSRDASMRVKCRLRTRVRHQCQIQYSSSLLSRNALRMANATRGSRTRQEYLESGQAESKRLSLKISTVGLKMSSLVGCRLVYVNNFELFSKPRLPILDESNTHHPDLAFVLQRCGPKGTSASPTKMLLFRETTMCSMLNSIDPE